MPRVVPDEVIVYTPVVCGGSGAGLSGEPMVGQQAH